MDLTPNPIIVPMTIASNNQAVPMTVASNMQEVSLEPSAVVLPMPKKTSDLINDGEDGTSTYVETDELSDVAISGAYYDLRHKPSINGVELVGDKTFADLGLEIDETPTEDSENAVSSGGVYDALENKLTIFHLHPTFTFSSKTHIEFTLPQNEHQAVISADHNQEKFAISLNVFGLYNVIAFVSRLDLSKNMIVFSTPCRDDFSGNTYFMWVKISILNALGEINLTIVDLSVLDNIPTKTSDLTNDGEGGTSTYVEADELASVATSGSYNDLADKPTIPAAQVNSDWDANSGVAQILNKPSIPSKTSDLTNDSDYTTDAEMDAELALKANSAGASANYAAKLSAAIPCGKLDSTSTATVMTATVPGITELKDGVCVFLQNGVITSASGFTLNINGLGAKPVYSSMAAATRVTTAWNVNYTMLFVYNEDRVEDGCWDMYYGIDNNTNTIGYQLRTNSQTMPMVGGVMYRYRLMFTAANGQGYVAANHSSSTNATAARTPATEKIDPHGPIFYYGTTAAVAAGSRPSAAYLWQQYALSLGYSFNNTGAALTLSTYDPVYVKCTPQSDGSAIIDPATPYVQQLPTSADGSIYIFLGVAYSATNIELETNHPVYYHDGDGIKLWAVERTLPKAPTVDGTYSLKCTVNNGVATYSWIND